MEEIDLTEIYEYFKKKIGIIVVVVLLFGILGFVYSNVYKVPLFQSYTTVILGSNTSLNTATTSSIDAGNGYVGGNLYSGKITRQEVSFAKREQKLQ